MAIASPNENVYYYECNNGQFRLFYFMPARQLKELCDKKRISRKVLEDFPDGVDLGCTEADFKRFEEDYNYTIPLDPRALRNAFYAIFSTTRKWEKFRGSGFIPAADLEGRLNKVDGVLKKEKIILEGVKPTQEKLSLRQLHRSRRREDVLERKTHKVLQKLQVKGINPDLTLPEQKFSDIKRQRGVDAKEVFLKLHQQKRKEE